MEVNPDLISHTQFHKAAWLQSTERPSWYYFTKKKRRSPISNKDFIKSLDEPLKELVKILHKKGIKTTPSCSGHHISERNFEKIFDDLKKDTKAIKTTGLHFKDVESGKLIFYHNPAYTLPWGKHTFVKKVTTYQQKGVLGIILGNHRKIKQQLLDLKIERVIIKEIDSIVFIFTNENQKNHISLVWRKITKEIKKILKEVN